MFTGEISGLEDKNAPQSLTQEPLPSLAPWKLLLGALISVLDKKGTAGTKYLEGLMTGHQMREKQVLDRRREREEQERRRKKEESPEQETEQSEAPNQKKIGFQNPSAEFFDQMNLEPGMAGLTFEEAMLNDPNIRPYYLRSLRTPPQQPGSTAKPWSLGDDFGVGVQGIEQSRLNPYSRSTGSGNSWKVL